MDPYTPEGVSQRDINSEEELEDAQTRKDKRFAGLEGKLVEERARRTLKGTGRNARRRSDRTTSAYQGLLPCQI
jgi:hypothetical protein